MNRGEKAIEWLVRKKIEKENNLLAPKEMLRINKNKGGMYDSRNSRVWSIYPQVSY